MTADVKSDLGIELNDYRWHQVCVFCSDAGCRTYLDNHFVENLETENIIEPISGNYRKLIIGDFNFVGKVQDLEDILAKPSSLNDQSPLQIKLK